MDETTYDFSPYVMDPSSYSSYDFGATPTDFANYSGFDYSPFVMDTSYFDPGAYDPTAFGPMNDPMAYLQDSSNLTSDYGAFTPGSLYNPVPNSYTATGDTIINGANGNAAGYVDSAGMYQSYPSAAAANGVQYTADGDAIINDPNGNPLGYIDKSGKYQSYADIAAANSGSATAAQKAAQGVGGSAGGGSQQKQQQAPTTPAKTATQSGLSQAALIGQLIAALGAKGVKPPKPDAANNRAANQMSWKRFATGGLNSVSPRAQPSVTGHVNHPTGGQDDMVDAKLGGGEYVMDADVVAALGDGNTDAGAAKLDEMRHNIRKHKRSAAADQIPPKAKSPLAYFRGKK